MVVTVVSAQDADRRVKEKVFAVAEPAPRPLPVYRCLASFGDSKVEHYVLQAPDVVSEPNKAAVADLLLSRAGRLFGVLD
jgi:hypothetical protein